MEFYTKTAEEALRQLRSDTDGLSTDEAEKRLKEHGPNRLAEGKKISLAARFLKQLADPMIVVLLAAAVLSGITSFYSGETMADSLIILFVVVLNSVLGVVQESKAENAIEALKSMEASTSHVLRNGKLAVIRSENLVPGDVIRLEAGDAVPADARILECASMQVEEAALTGESVPVLKDPSPISSSGTALGDRKNMLYMGSTVVYGRGSAVVCCTGMETEMGRIADALSKAEDESTPLQRKLSSLSRILTFLVLGICALIFVAGILRSGSLSMNVLLDTFMMAVSLAVAAIPEGLAAVVTIVLSIGVTKMASKNAVIRRLTAVETLGCTQVICSDKTGTLTQNRMTVMETFGKNEQLLAKGMALCSDAELDSVNIAVGEPTECALVNFAFRQGFHKDQLKQELPRIAEAPFDSIRKMMSTLHRSDDGILQFTKGAPDEILSRCSFILTTEGTRPLTDEERANILRQNKDMADRALRVLACACRRYDALPAFTAPSEIERELCFIGLCGMIDPVRPEVRPAIEKCLEAGIRPVMITGDHIDTAVAIARELGLLTDASQAMPGRSLDSMSDDELEKKIPHLSVFARVQPEHKVRIVEAWKRLGCVTTMTGDGVNDAPSLKAADIGIGMGITGTDVTRSVADMILADDNFATIVAAVEEGRRIYANIRKTIQFLLSSNLSEVLSVFTATMLGFTILKPVHILWINLLTDSLPALALGMEEGEADSMRRPPRDPKAGIFSGGAGIDIAYQGIAVSVLTLFAYFLGHYIESGVWEVVNSPDGMTMAFLTMSMAEIFHSFNMRSLRGSLLSMRRQNLWLIGGATAAFLLTTAVIYIPFLSNLFGFTAISPKEYLLALGLAALILPAVELVKFCQRRAAGKRRSSAR